MKKKKTIVRLAVLTGLFLLALYAVLSVTLVRNSLVLRFLTLTHREIAEPAQYGTFHLAFLGGFAALLLLSVILHTRVTRETLDSIVFIFGCFFFGMELYKQLYYHTVLGNGHYDFSVLPLQLCSYVLYLYLLLPFLREGRLKDVLYRFAALYQTAAGAIVMFCPLFYNELARSVHTMLWHIAMVVSGVLILFVRGYGRSYVRDVFPAAGVFLALYAFGLTLDAVLHPFTENSSGPLNLYYLSPYEETNNIIIGDVRDAYGWLPAVIAYALLLTFVCVSAVWLVGFLAVLIKRRLNGEGGETNGKRAED